MSTTNFTPTVERAEISRDAGKRKIRETLRFVKLISSGLVLAVLGISILQKNLTIFVFLDHK
jgi:hypothetical protein